MKTTIKLKRYLIISLLMVLLIGAFSTGAALEIEKVYPTLGALGSPLSITIKGDGFDNSTRVTLALDSGNRRSVVGGVNTRVDFAWDVIIDGNIAYVAYGPGPWEREKQEVGGLQVVDISNLEDLQVIAEVTTIGPAYSMGLHNDNLFIAGGSHQLQVVDISDPNNPIQKTIGKNKIPEYYEERCVKIHEGKAYVADDTNGLYVIDISNPAAPQSIANKPIIGFKAKSVDLKNNYAFVTGRPPGVATKNGVLVVVDVTNPSAMEIVGSVMMPTWWVYGVTVEGDYAYVATSHFGIQVVDISDPEHPEIVHAVNTNGRAFGVTVTDQTAYVADNLNGVTVLDVTDPININTKGIIDTPGQTQQIALKDDFACVADGEFGLQVVDIKAPAVQQVIAWVPTPGVSQYFERKGDYIYLGDGGGGLQVIDISNPETPFIAGHAPTTNSARHVDVVGNLAYIADQQGGLQIADISDPTNPRIIGTGYIPSDPWTRYVTVVEDYDIAFLANKSRLILVDVSDPENPTYKTQLTGFSGLDGIIAIIDNYAYVPEKGRGNIHVVNFSDPDNPTVVETIEVVPGGTDEGPRAVSIVGNKAYVANGDHGLCVLDISNPANPIFNPSWSIEDESFDRAYFVTVVGNIAYIADGNSGIQIIDVSDPANMMRIGFLDTAGGANCLSISGDKAFVGDFGNGFIVVPLPVPIIPITVHSANRISCTLPSPIWPGHYDMQVYNANFDNDTEAGAVTFSENIKASKAIIVAAGNYIIPQEQKLEEEFQQVANEAYNALLYQGFRKDDIQYLGPDLNIDADGINGADDVDALNTIENINWAFNTWAASQSPHDIYVYLVGHGSTGYYKPNQNRMLADEVKALVTGLKSVVTGEVIFVYEACRSGAFLLNMDESPGNSPVIITSSQSNQKSWFYDLGEGLISFSSGFWESVSSRQGARLDKAFRDGKSKIKDMQTAWMDVNGDLLPNTGQDTTEIIIVGRGYPPNKPLPIIGNVSESLSLNGSTSATIWATGIVVSGEGNSLAEVFAIITPPCYNPIPSIPGTEDDLEKVVLTDGNADGVYEGVYTNFPIDGTYVVTIYARDSEGRLSDPAEMVVYKNPDPDDYEDDDTYSVAKEITLNDNMAQCHNFYEANDEDWIKFFALAGNIYLIEASNLGPDNNVVIEIFDTDGTTLLTRQDNPDNARADEGLYWRCNEDGLYYARIRPAGPDNFGPGTDYRLEVYRPVAELFGAIAGSVKNSTGHNVENVTIKTDKGGSGISKDGNYFMVHGEDEKIRMTMKANGYKEKNIPNISVAEAQTTIVDANLEPMVVDTEPIIEIVSPDSDVTIFEGESVNFQATTTNGNAPFTYVWDFNGGAVTVIGEDPGDVTFAIQGEYRVSVTVEDADKDSKTSESVIVKVNKNMDPGSVPNVTITSPTSDVTIVASQAVNFKASLKGGNAPFDYTWDFKGGAANTSVEDPGNVVFATPGIYTVRVTVEDNERDQDSAEMTVTVVADLKPIAAIQSPASDVTIDMGAAVNFQGAVTSGNPPFEYTWDFDGAALASTAEDPGSVTFAVPGTYAISFTVEDANGDEHSDTVTITVNRTNSGGGGGGGCFLSTMLP